MTGQVHRDALCGRQEVYQKGVDGFQDGVMPVVVPSLLQCIGTAV